MSIVKRKNPYIGLKDLDIFIEDTAFDSQYFRVLECPTVLTQGKSSFLIGGSTYLKPGIELKFELIHDLTKEVIYTEAVFGHLEGDLRRVSIEIYADVEPGPSTLYVVGELNPTEIDIPLEWQGIYNVRWKKNITINAAGVNTQPIFFYKQPRISVSEIFRGYLNVPTIATSSVYLTGSGEPRQGLNPIEPTINTDAQGNVINASYPQLDFANKASLAAIEENKPLNKLTGRKGHIVSQGKLQQTNSPVSDDYIITVDGGIPVSSSYVGNTFTINNPQVNTSTFTLETYHSAPTVYTSSVMKVKNSTSFIPSDVFYVNDTRTSPSTLVPAPLASQVISASYKAINLPTTSSFNYFSFADIQLSSLRTFSGDVHKVKLYSKAEGSLGDFELIYDSPIESSEIFFDDTDATLFGNMGYFIGQTRLDQYWQIYQGDGGNGGSGTLTYDSVNIVDSMKISGSNLEYGHELRVDLIKNLNFKAGHLYSFKAKLYGKKKPKKDIDGNVGNNGEFQIYVIGDAFNKDTTEASHWGVLKLSVPSFPSETDEYNFGIIEGSFIADNTGTGKVQFKVPSGEWYVSDISLKAATDTAFNPEYVRVVAPMPPLYSRPDQVRFLAEFYDVNNNIADTIIFSDFFNFEGENTTIGGTDNILSGSLYIGSEIGGGVEMAGVTSGFIRSIGYLGFISGSAETGGPGFMLWSGSALSDVTDEYAGVGLELFGTSESYLRYRTDPSELDIRANTFFVGSETSQYISGSGGNIEISSSNFHVSSSGDVTMTGTITATAGNIGDWIIKDGKLSGSNATLDATGAALYMSDKGPDTDGTATFDIRRDEYYIDFTPADQGNTTNYFIKFGPNFAVDSDGVLIASGAIFEGQITASTGQIGGASIESASLAYFPYWRISSSADISDPASFISSSAFKVSAGGVVTGSQVLFTGGKIAGATISDTKLSYGSNWLISASAQSNEYFISSSKFNVKQSGDVSGSQVLFTGGKIAGFTIDGTQLKQGTSFFIDGDGSYFISSSNFQVRPSGDVSGSQVLFTGGKIAGFTIATSGITSTDIGVHPSGQTYAFTAGSSNEFNVKHSGQITGSDVLFTGGKIAGWTLASDKFSAGSGGTYIALIPGTGIQMGDSTFGDAPFSVTNAGVLKAESGTIAGWTIDSSTLTGGNMIINKDGSVKSSGYVSNVAGSGFILSAVSGGYLEVENAKIRGTLATAVFEKESVSAVGGQLYIANATTLTSSIHHPQNYYKASDTTMSVVNVTGFVDGEILSAKKVSTSGFATEYIYVNSASRNNASSDTDYSGQIYVTRGYGSGVSGESGSLGDTPAAAQTYSGSQVIVSTGKLNTGFIRLNANPNDTTTPYIDIVERTGSNIYDVKLKARLGDLSGVAGVGAVPSSPGFGLYSDNVYLDGVISASAGYVGQWNIESGVLKYSDLFKLDATATGSQPVISSSKFKVDSEGNVTASNIQLSGNISSSEGIIGGWTINSASLSKDDIKLQAAGTADSTGVGGPGLYITDKYGNDIVTIVSGGLYEIGAATDEAVNDSFEVTQSGQDTGGYHLGTSASPLSILSWSFSSTGPISHSLTMRSGSGFEKFNRALVGDYTFDVMRPGFSAPSMSLSQSTTAVSTSYAIANAAGLHENNYELSQIVSASSQASNTWVAGNVVSFAFVGKMSHSLGGAGYDRGLEPQKYRVDYWNTANSTWKTFIPEDSGSDGFGKFDLSQRYTSIKASNQLPVSTHKLRIVISGSINSDISFQSEEDLYEELKLDPLYKLLKQTGKLPAKVTESVTNTPAASAKYPYTEITFDNFRLIQDQPRIQLSQDGFLLYQSENSYFRMTPSKLDMRSSTDGGAAFGKTVTGKASMGGAGIHGRFAAPKLQAYDADTADVETYSFSGNTDEYARGNHTHKLPFDTLNDAATGTFTNGTWNSAFGSTARSNISGSLGSNATLIRTLTAVGISGSFTSVSSSLAARLTSEEGEAEGSVISSSAQIATDISGSWQGSIDISSDTNLVGGTGITLTGDTLSTTDSEIVHGSLSGFVANEHIDHSGVTLTTGTGLTGGGDITTNRTFAVDFSDSTLQSNISGSWQGYITGSGILSASAQFESDVSGSWQGYITGSGIVSSSAFSSPSQGTVRATINGVTTDVDTGLQTGDTPTFSNLIATNTVSASNFYLSSSAAVVVHMGHGGDTLGKWEWHRDGTRRWLIYNEGRTNQSPIPQDSMVFKHGLVTDGNDHINFHMEQDDQTVYFHGDISGSANLDITGNALFSQYIYHRGDDDTFMRFEPDKITFVAGDANMIYMVQGSAGIQADKVTINNDLADIDFQVKGDNLANLIRTDAVNDRVGIGFTTFSSVNDLSSSLHIGGDLTIGSGSALGHVTASGNISASGTITADTFDGTSVSDALAAAIVAEIDAGEIPIAKLAASTISGVSLGGNLASLSITANGGIGMTSYNGSAAVSDLALDIDGMTDIGAAVAGGDLLVIDDGAGGTNRKVTVDRLSTYVSSSAFATVSGDVVIASTGVATIQANSVALGTDTTGTYISTITPSSGIYLDGASSATSTETATPTLSVDSGSMAAYYSSSAFSKVSGDILITSTGVSTIQANSVALTTDTTGNYVGTLDVGAGMAAVNADGEGSSKTIAVDGVLEDLDTLGAAGSDGQFIVATGAGAFQYETTTTARTSLGIGTGDSPTLAGIIAGNVRVGVTGDNEIDTSSGNLTIDSTGGTITLDDNVIVSGNFTVSGTRTIIDSTTLNIADNIIELNAGTSDGGIYVKETSGGNATGSLLWDVSENRWVGGTAGSEANVVLVDTTDTLTNKTLTSPDINTPDIDGGTIDDATIGATTATTIKGTTIDATTDFTIGGTVITDNTITDDGTLVIASTTATSFSDGNITNVGDINVDSLSVDDAAVGLDIQFGGNTTLNKITLTDNLADALNINEGGNSYIKFITTNSSEQIVFGKNSTFNGTTIADLGTVTTANIDGGTVDGVTIGGASAGAGTFTTLASTGNTTLGDASGDTVTINGIAAGTDDSVVVIDGSGVLKHDEIDSRVWGTTLLDGTNGTDNEIAIFTDSDSVEGDSNLTWDGTTLTLGNTKAASSATFTSGFAGDGWRITDSGNTAVAEFDNLTVRGTMSVYELLIHQTRATNGSVWISNSSKVDSVTDNGSGDYTLFFDTGENYGHTFANDDLIRFQRWDNASSQLIQSNLRVYSSTKGSSVSASLITGGAPAAGYDYVRIGNLTDTDRQGSVYLTADDNDAPFIDVIDGVSAITGSNVGISGSRTKTRMGKLDGVTSARFGTLSGYGFYASGSAYLEGTINAKFGNIGTWGIGETAISSSDNIITLDAGAKRITITDGTNDQIYLGEVDGNSTYGMKIFDGSGGVADANRLVELGAGDNMIAGWDIMPGALKSDNAGGSVALSANSQSLMIFTGSIDNARPKVVVGKLPRVTGDADDDRYGFGVFTGTVDADIVDDSTYNVLITRDKAKLAGWDLVPGNIQSDNTDGSVRLSSVSQSLTIWTGSMDEAQPKLVLGKLPLHDGTDQTPYGFAVFNGTGTVSGSQDSASILITANKARLAGWELSPGKLSSGTVASIDGNNASLALGTGASTATATPTTGLFFVSASTKPVFYVGSTFSYTNDVLKAAGWTISSDAITSPTDNVHISASGGGYIALGKTAPTSISGSGIFLSGSGDFLAGNHTGNKIQYAQGPGAIVMKSNTFSLDATTIVIDSSANDGKIALGATPPSAYNSGKGIYMDGTGKLLAGKAAGERIQYDGSDTLIMSASTFLMGTSGSANYTGAYVSGSNGNIEISSSNFFLKSDGSMNAGAGAFTLDTSGNVFMSGSVSASYGNIGGFQIGTNTLTTREAGIGHSSQDYAFWAGHDTPASAEFRVTHEGVVTATSATLTGGITASTGDIGGWVIDSTKLRKTSGGGSVELRTGTGFIGLAVSESNDIPIVTVGSSSTPFASQVEGETNRFTASIGNFEHTAFDEGNYIDHISRSYSGTAAANPLFSYNYTFTTQSYWGQDAIFTGTPDSGSHKGTRHWTDKLVLGAAGEWPPDGYPIAWEYGISKQVRCIGDELSNPTNDNDPHGFIKFISNAEHDSTTGDDIQITDTGTSHAGSASISPGSAGAEWGSGWLSSYKKGTSNVGHVNYKMRMDTEGTPDSFDLYINNSLVVNRRDMTTAPLNIGNGLGLSWDSTTGHQISEGFGQEHDNWLIPINVSGSIKFDPDNDRYDTSTNSKAALIPSGTLAFAPNEDSQVSPSITLKLGAIADVGSSYKGALTQWTFYVKEKDNSDYVNSAAITDWGNVIPEHKSYTLTAKLYERTGAGNDDYTLLTSKNIPLDSTQGWIKHTVKGSIGNSGLTNNHLFVELQAAHENKIGPLVHHYLKSIVIDNMSLNVSTPIVDINQDGLLVYSSPDSFLKIDNTGMELKSEETTFNRVIVNESIAIHEPSGKFITSGSIDSVASQSKFTGEMVFYNEDNFLDTQDSFEQLASSGSISIDSGSIQFRTIINNTVTGSGGTVINYGADNTYSTTPFGSSWISIDAMLNSGAILGTTGLGNSTPTKVGINTTMRQNTFHPSSANQLDFPTPYSDSGPQATLHVYRPSYTDWAEEPMILMESSASNASEVYVGWTHKLAGASPTTHEWTMGLDGTNDKLHIAGGNSLDTKVVTITEEANTSGTGRVGILDTTPSYPLQVAGYDGSNITIYAQRDIAAYSDVRSKTDILTISGSLDTIGNIRGVTYRNIGDDGFGTGSKMMGVIAQELEPYLPEIVSTDDEGFKSVKYGNLTALLIQAVKEQQEQIEDLKEEVKEIKDAVSS